MRERRMAPIILGARVNIVRSRFLGGGGCVFTMRRSCSGELFETKYRRNKCRRTLYVR
jgi:hypothetical protein